MFDRVGGTALDREARRRGFVSFGFTSFLFGAGGLGFLVGSLAVVAGDEPVIIEEVVLLDPAGGGLPDRPLPAASQAPAPAPDAEPDPTAEPVATQAEPVSTPAPGSGTSEGEPGPGGDGPGTGAIPGTGTGTNQGKSTGATPKVYYHDPVKVIRKYEPRYPETAKSFALGPQRCVGLVTIGKDGVPIDVVVEGCDPAFHATTRDGLLRWRFKPPTDGKNQVEARTRVAITYVLD